MVRNSKAITCITSSRKRRWTGVLLSLYQTHVFSYQSILLSKDELTTKTCVQTPNNGDTDFGFTEEGTLENYPGVNIAKLPDGIGFNIFQPFLIDRCIKAINVDSTTAKSVRDNVQVGFPLLNKDMDGPAQKSYWKYLGLIGMFGYLQ